MPKALYVPKSGGDISPPSRVAVYRHRFLLHALRNLLQTEGASNILRLTHQRAQYVPGKVRFPMSFATPEREFYSPRELEAISGLSHATIYRMLARGKLIAKKLGTKTLISAASYRALMAELPPAQVQPARRTRRE